MPRRARDRGPGYFHVSTKGNNAGDIFWTSDDRRVFLALLVKTGRDLGWTLHIWCLMTNHFHFIVQTPEPNLSTGMQRLNGVFAKCFNDHHSRRDHLFGRRFWSKRIENDEQLLQAGAYIRDNPVRAGLCADPLDWRWLGGPLLPRLAGIPVVGRH